MTYKYKSGLEALLIKQLKPTPTQQSRKQNGPLTTERIKSLRLLLSGLDEARAQENSETKELIENITYFIHLIDANQNANIRS
jgi:hypothetical protein